MYYLHYAVLHTPLITQTHRTLVPMWCTHVCQTCWRWTSGRAKYLINFSFVRIDKSIYVYDAAFSLFSIIERNNFIILYSSHWFRYIQWRVFSPTRTGVGRTWLGPKDDSLMVHHCSLSSSLTGPFVWLGEWFLSANQFSSWLFTTWPILSNVLSWTATTFNNFQKR